MPGATPHMVSSSNIQYQQKHHGKTPLSSRLLHSGGADIGKNCWTAVGRYCFKNLYQTLWGIPKWSSLYKLHFILDLSYPEQHSASDGIGPTICIECTTVPLRRPSGISSHRDFTPVKHCNCLQTVLAPSTAIHTRAQKMSMQKAGIAIPHRNAGACTHARSVPPGKNFPCRRIELLHVCQSPGN